jgi:hypothetical protein
VCWTATAVWDIVAGRGRTELSTGRLHRHLFGGGLFLAAFFLAAFMDVAELEAEMDRFPATTGGAAGRSGVDGSETTDKTTFQWPTITVSPWKN